MRGSAATAAAMSSAAATKSAAMPTEATAMPAKSAAMPGKSAMAVEPMMPVKAMPAITMPIMPIAPEARISVSIPVRISIGVIRRTAIIPVVRRHGTTTQ